MRLLQKPGSLGTHPAYGCLVRQTRWDQCDRLLLGTSLGLLEMDLEASSWLLQYHDRRSLYTDLGSERDLRVLIE